MIYARLVFTEPTPTTIKDINSFIDYLTTKLGMDNVDWDTKRTKLKLKYTSSDITHELLFYLKENFHLAKLCVYNIGDKTETIYIVEGKSITGTYILPLFPEEYIF